MLFSQVLQDYQSRKQNLLLLDDPCTLNYNPKTICINNKNTKCVRLTTNSTKFKNIIDGSTPNHFNRRYDNFTMF